MKMIRPFKNFSLQASKLGTVREFMKSYKEIKGK